MGRILCLLAVLLVMSLDAPGAYRVEAGRAPLEAVTARAAGVHAGPGDTYTRSGALSPGQPVTILERSAAGNWLHVAYGDGADGWVMTGTLELAPDFRLDDVPLNTSLPDADLANVRDEALAALYAAPVIPTISETMRETYRLGQTLGIRRAAITKVGDSVSTSALYLTQLREGGYDLGPYGYLEATVRYFAPSLAVNSAAARIGLTAFSVFDPAWSSSRCQAGEPPLACEYRRKKPSVALIMFGPNDVGLLNSEQYEAQMRQIVDETLARGIIPVLSTFSADPDAEKWPQAVRFNGILVEMARDYELPLMNLWAAARALPGYGLGEDGAHLTASGAHLNLATGHESVYGVSLQNLLALVTLDKIRREIIQPE